MRKGVLVMLLAQSTKHPLTRHIHKPVFLRHSLLNLLACFRPEELPVVEVLTKDSLDELSPAVVDAGRVLRLL